jgi:hypothetical protein
MKTNPLASRLRCHSILIGTAIFGLPIALHLSTRIILAAGTAECFPFLGTSPIPGELTVLSGSGQVTSSSHPKVLKPGFGRSLKLSAGGYNPQQKKLMLVINNRYFGLFLNQPLIENQAIAFRAEPCGEVNDKGVLLGRMIRPGLFFDFNQRAFQGVLTKTGQRLQGTFSASSGFYLSNSPGDPLVGRAKGRFELQVKPGKDERFPEPSGDAIRGLW